MGNTIFTMDIVGSPIACSRMFPFSTRKLVYLNTIKEDKFNRMPMVSHTLDLMARSILLPKKKFNTNEHNNIKV